jgi:hypothetical protein
MLVGPTSNPAELKDNDDIFTMFNKLVSTGNRDVTVNASSIFVADQIYNCFPRPLQTQRFVLQAVFCPDSTRVPRTLRRVKYL